MQTNQSVVTVNGKQYPQNVIVQRADRVVRFIREEILQNPQIDHVIKMLVTDFIHKTMMAEEGLGRNLHSAIHLDQDRRLFDGTLVDLLTFDFVFTMAPNNVPFDPATTSYPYKLYQFYLRLDHTGHPVQFIHSVTTH